MRPRRRPSSATSCERCCAHMYAAVTSWSWSPHCCFAFTLPPSAPPADVWHGGRHTHCQPWGRPLAPLGAQIDGRLYRQTRGIPQGSILSSLLCCAAYAAMERTNLAHVLAHTQRPYTPRPSPAPRPACATGAIGGGPDRTARCSCDSTGDVGGALGGSAGSSREHHSASPSLPQQTPPLPEGDAGTLAVVAETPPEALGADADSSPPCLVPSPPTATAATGTTTTTTQGSLPVVRGAIALGTTRIGERCAATPVSPQECPLPGTAGAYAPPSGPPAPPPTPAPSLRVAEQPGGRAEDAHAASASGSAAHESHGGEDLVVRLVDDFLFVSPSRRRAAAFVEALERGVEAFGCRANAAKTRTNLDDAHGRRGHAVKGKGRY